MKYRWILLAIAVLYISTIDEHSLQVSKAVWLRGRPMEKVWWAFIMCLRQIDFVFSILDNIIDYTYPLKAGDVEITIITGNPRSGTTNLQMSLGLTGAKLEDIICPSYSAKLLMTPFKKLASQFIQGRMDTTNHNVNQTSFIEEQFWLWFRFKSPGTVTFFPSILSDAALLNQTLNLSKDDISYMINNMKKLARFEGSQKYVGASFFTIPYHQYLNEEHNIRFIFMKRDLHDLFPSTMSLWKKIWTGVGYESQIDELTLFYLKWTSDNVRFQEQLSTNDSFYVIQSKDWFKINEKGNILEELQQFMGAKVSPIPKQESHKYDETWKYWKSDEGIAIIDKYLDDTMHFPYELI